MQIVFRHSCLRVKITAVGGKLKITMSWEIIEIQVNEA